MTTELRKPTPSTVLIASLLALMLAAPALARAKDEKPNASPSKKLWKPEDIVMRDSASQFRVSPDGKWAVWVKGSPDKDKDLNVSNLVFSSLTEKKKFPSPAGPTPSRSRAGRRIAS